jgi:Tol biopolymer transport system component
VRWREGQGLEDVVFDIHGRHRSVSGFVAMDAAGRYLAFTTADPDVVEDDSNEDSDIFRYDLDTDEVLRVTLSNELTDAPAGDPAHAQLARQQGLTHAYFREYHSNLDISDDGSVVAFSTTATVVGGDTNGTRDVFLRDLRAGLTRRVSLDQDGGQGSSHSGYPAVSADSRVVVFESLAALSPDDTDDTWDVYVYDDQAPR